jgi:hypothetical protein
MHPRPRKQVLIDDLPGNLVELFEPASPEASLPGSE